MDSKATSSIDEYIAACPAEIQKSMKEMRAIIRAAAPDAEEKISYRMPAFAQNGILVWFAAFKDHIGFYPKGSGIQAFEKELAGYETSKGTIRFPLSKPLPRRLITKIVKYRITENLKTAKKK